MAKNRRFVLAADPPAPSDRPSNSSSVADRHPVRGSLPQDVGWLATTYGIVSAIGYTLANVCLRSLTDLDPFWVSQLKALPLVVGVAPLVVLRSVRGQTIIPSLRILWIVILAGIVGQLAGNVAFQWSLGVIGIALSVPLTLGTMIVSGAVLGWAVLGDRVSQPIAVASTILIVAIGILSLGAPQANASIQNLAAEMSRSDGWRVLAGVAAACLSGVAYSGLGVAVRLASNRGMPISSLLLVVGVTGVVLLGAIVQWRPGHLPWHSLHGETLFYVLAAGTFNLGAFAALTKALHLSSVVFVNALNASQTAMAAVIGVLMFGEASSWPMLVGVLLTVLGLLMMKRRRRPPLPRTDGESRPRDVLPSNPQ